jgi:thiamine biosynthesis lipoprotein
VTSPQSISVRALGTTAVLATTDPEALLAARAPFLRLLRAFDLACSRFRDDSELTALNAAAGAPTAVSPLLAQAIGVALRAARITHGAVVPTLGAEIAAAGYDRDFAEVAARGSELVARDDELALPGDETLAAGQARVAFAPSGADGTPRRRSAWSAVRLDRARRTVTLPDGVALDLGATAKALAADRAARAALAACSCGVLVSLGGDVAVAGPAPDGGWVIRVTDDHSGPRDAVGQIVTIRSGGLATSGTTVRRWQAAGTPRHHILDPRTGEPAAVVWRTASVAAATCVDANTASTAAIVRGADAAPWLLRHGLPARLVAASGRVLLLGAWPRRDAVRASAAA